MFDVRRDYLTGLDVFMSSRRAMRPDFLDGEIRLGVTKAGCPFCPENKNELAEVISEDYGGRVIVVKNKYPAISSCQGCHEVVVDTDNHDEEFASFPAERIGQSLKIIIKRYKKLMECKNTAYVQVFKNDGRGSGASINHSHWQIISMPFIPERQQTIHKNFAKYHEENGVSYIESLYERREFIVYENDTIFAYMPYAAPYGYNVNIATKRHMPSLLDLGEQETLDFARGIQAVLYGLRLQLGWFAYNICFQNPPKGLYQSSHFFIQIIPRRGGFAGLEISSDVYINSHFPEKYAGIIAGDIKKGGF